MLQQFAGVALAHFLALLVPGVDFFLIARTALASGWRRASGVCVGIAAANGLIIAAAFTGLALVTQPAVLLALKVAGGLFLTYVGVAFLRARGHLALEGQPDAAASGWLRNVGLGLASGLLNPKNIVFYVSLAAALAGAPPWALVGYGVWMVTVVGLWDVFVARVLGSPRALERFARVLPLLTRVAGGFLVLFGGVMLVEVAVELAARSA